jgi:hypothetical protein
VAARATHKAACTCFFKKKSKKISVNYINTQNKATDQVGAHLDGRGCFGLEQPEQFGDGRGRRARRFRGRALGIHTP